MSCVALPSWYVIAVFIPSIVMSFTIAFCVIHALATINLAHRIVDCCQPCDQRIAVESVALVVQAAITLRAMRPRATVNDTADTFCWRYFNSANLAGTVLSHVVRLTEVIREMIAVASANLTQPTHSSPRACASASGLAVGLPAFQSASACCSISTKSRG